MSIASQNTLLPQDSSFTPSADTSNQSEPLQKFFSYSPPEYFDTGSQTIPFHPFLGDVGFSPAPKFPVTSLALHPSFPDSPTEKLYNARSLKHFDPLSQPRPQKDHAAAVLRSKARAATRTHTLAFPRCFYTDSNGAIHKAPLPKSIDTGSQTVPSHPFLGNVGFSPAPKYFDALPLPQSVDTSNYYYLITSVIAIATCFYQKNKPKLNSLTQLRLPPSQQRPTVSGFGEIDHSGHIRDGSDTETDQNYLDLSSDSSSPDNIDSSTASPPLSDSDIQTSSPHDSPSVEVIHFPPRTPPQITPSGTPSLESSSNDEDSVPEHILEPSLSISHTIGSVVISPKSSHSPSPAPKALASDTITAEDFKTRDVHFPEHGVHRVLKRSINLDNVQLRHVLTPSPKKPLKKPTRLWRGLLRRGKKPKAKKPTGKENSPSTLSFRQKREKFETEKPKRILGRKVRTGSRRLYRGR